MKGCSFVWHCYITPQYCITAVAVYLSLLRCYPEANNDEKRYRTQRATSIYQAVSRESQTESNYRILTLPPRTKYAAEVYPPTSAPAQPTVSCRFVVLIASGMSHHRWRRSDRYSVTIVAEGISAPSISQPEHSYMDYASTSQTRVNRHSAGVHC
jgi:hypothetical protein